MVTADDKVCRHLLCNDDTRAVTLKR